jgi:hypothetical protein
MNARVLEKFGFGRQAVVDFVFCLVSVQASQKATFARVRFAAKAIFKPPRPRLLRNQQRAAKASTSQP